MYLVADTAISKHPEQLPFRLRRRSIKAYFPKDTLTVGLSLRPAYHEEPNASSMLTTVHTPGAAISKVESAGLAKGKRSISDV